jgi:hypothetical protein
LFSAGFAQGGHVVEGSGQQKRKKMEGKSLRLDKKLDDSVTPFTGEGRFFSRHQASLAFTRQVRPAYDKTTKMRERKSVLLSKFCWGFLSSKMVEGQA